MNGILVKVKKKKKHELSHKSPLLGTMYFFIFGSSIRPLLAKYINNCFHKLSFALSYHSQLTTLLNRANNLPCKHKENQSVYD